MSSVNKNEDEYLIINAANGDRYSFEEIIKRYQKKVINLIYSFVNDTNEVEDIAQEIFLKIWKYAHDFKGQSKFSTWLYRIAVNSCLNYKKQKKVESESVEKNENMLGINVNGNSISPEALIEKRELEVIIKEAIEKLPHRQRMALILSRFEGYSYKKIAEIMEVSLSSVETLLYRAKTNLGKILLPFKKDGKI
jgi:RNA polymerase sigma-70 factor (ECF subfamily)